MGLISKFTASTTLSININLEWSCVSATKNVVACGLDMYNSLLSLNSLWLARLDNRETFRTGDVINYDCSRMCLKVLLFSQSTQNI